MLKHIKKAAEAVKGSSQSDKDAIVALDIGTENVKALIAYAGQDGLMIVGAGRATQGLNDMHAGAISDIAAVVENCDSALRQAEEQSDLRGSRVVVGIAGELIKGITNSVMVKRNDPNKPLDSSEIDQIVKKAQAKAYKDARAEVLLELSSSDVELRLVNSALVSINIDGYKVTNPVGFQGSQVEVQLYTAFAPLVHIGAIERVVSDLDMELVAVAAEPFAVSRSVIGDDPEASMSAILIDTGGGTTDIAVLRDGGLEGTRMFAIGGRSFTRAIARDLNIDFAEAEKLKLSLSERDMNDLKRKQVESALQKTVDVWIQGVHLALAEFDWLDYLPSKILLCGGGAGLRQLRQALVSKSWQEGLPFAQPPKPQFITVDDVVGFEDRTGKVKDHTMITVAGLARVGSDTLNHVQRGSKGKLEKILEN